MSVTNETIQKDIQQLSRDLGARLTTLEDGIAQKIREVVTELITTVKAELEEKMEALADRVRTLEQRPAAPPHDDRSLNVVIYGMAESEEENVTVKVNDLLSNQLQLEDVRVTEAVRKEKFEGRDAGVIIAKWEHVEAKRKVMQAKSRLNTTEHFGHIRIDHDKPRWQRQHETNMRLLVRSIGANKLYVRGNRIC